MIAVLGWLADVERDLIRTRTAGGRSRAKARGQYMGRPANFPMRREQRRAAVGLRGNPPGIGRQLQRGQSDDFTACGISNAWPLSLKAWSK